MPEDRFLGLLPVKWRLNLTRYRPVRALLRSRWFPFIPIVVNLFIFTVILMAGFTGGLSAGNYNFGIMIVWIVWWVVLMMLLVPVFARSWCLMCPLPVFGEWIQRRTLLGVRPKLWGLNRRWPRALRNMWLMNFLFVATTFTTGFITTRPIATFILLSTIIVAAIVLSIIYEKRAFCVYGCPVSGFQGLYSNFAMTEIRVINPDICKDHKPKTCVLGNEKGYGCPWFEIPYKMSRNTYCGMCCECFKSCPYDNMGFFLRPPGTDLLVQEKRGLDEAWKAFIMLGVAVFFFLIMQGPWGFMKDWANATTAGGFLAFVGVHSAFNLVLVPAVFLAFAWLATRLSGDSQASVRKAFINFSYSLVPLGLAAWVAFSFGILLPNGSYVLHILSDPFAWGWDLLGTAAFPWTPFLTGWMPVLQIVTLLGGLAFACDLTLKLSRQTFNEPGQARRAALPIYGFLVLATITLTSLFVG